MAFDAMELFGGGPDEGPDEKMMLAMILSLLMDRLTGRREDETAEEIGRREIPVRPRVEPLGG